jgi:hypothetical protein
MIVVVDPVCTGCEHVAYNAGLLETIRMAYPDEPLVFWGESEHLRQVRGALSATVCGTIQCHPGLVAKRHSIYARRLYSELWLLARAMPAETAGERITLVLSTFTPATLAALTLLNPFLRTKPQMQAVLHGGVSDASCGRPSRIPLRRVADVRTALRLTARLRLQLIALEFPLRDALLQAFPYLEGRVEVLEHPIPPVESCSGRVEFEIPLRFGFLGNANSEKGFDHFLRLAESIVPRHSRRATFHAIGASSGEIQVEDKAGVLATPPARSKLSRAAFTEAVRQIHFAVFPHSAQHYSLSPSGSLLDAIAWQKPLIASRIPTFEALFTRYGNIGYLYSEPQELQELVEGILNRADSVDYARQCQALEKLRSERFPAALAPVYRRIRENPAGVGPSARVAKF